MNWSEDTRLLIDTAREIAQREAGTPGSRHDIDACDLRALLPKFAEAGLAGINIPTQVGGQGGTLADSVLVIEAMAAVNPIAGDAIQALNFGAIRQIAQLGNAGIHQTYLTPLLEGTALTAVAMTEPEAGTAVSDLRTRATIDDQNVVLDGRKIFTTHGPTADFFVVWARFGETTKDIGCVVVERDAPGLTVDASNRFISGEHYGMLYLDECTVPVDNVMTEHDGFGSLISVFNVERLGNAARSLALGQLALDLAVVNLKQRIQGGKRLADQQGLRWKVAERATQLEAARQLLYKAARSDGLPSQVDTAMAKLACNRAGYEAADTAVQMFGGYGFDAESVVSYLYGRTRGWLIAGGTVEVMMDRIARAIFGG